jgi:hypothetical protein
MHRLVLTLILVPLLVISLTSLGVRLPLILRVILVDHHPMIGVVNHHPMIGVVIAVDKEDGGVDVGLTDYSVLRV